MLSCHIQSLISSAPLLQILSEPLHIFLYYFSLILSIVIVILNRREENPTFYIASYFFASLSLCDSRQRIRRFSQIVGLLPTILSISKILAINYIIFMFLSSLNAHERFNLMIILICLNEFFLRRLQSSKS